MNVAVVGAACTIGAALGTAVLGVAVGAVLGAAHAIV